MPTTPSQQQPPRLLQHVRDRIRTLHYSYRTEQAYVYWIRHYILFHDKRHPREMAKPEVEGFLTFLATQKKVSASTQNQALSALLFLYKKVLELEIGWVEDVVRAKKPTRVPVVLTRDEVSAVLQRFGPDIKDSPVTERDAVAVAGQIFDQRLVMADGGLGVDHPTRQSFAVPTDPMAFRAQPLEGGISVFSFEDPEKLRRGQASTPCSRRPIRSSTSLAPASVTRYCMGVLPPRAFSGCSSHSRAMALSPSKSWIACWKMFVSR